MKIISFGDIHEDTSKLARLKPFLKKADLVLISGDLTNCHGNDRIKILLENIRKCNNNTYAQYGNMDLPEVNEYLTGEGINLHGNGYLFENVGVFGCGGSSQTPFHTPSEIPEKDIEESLIKGYDKVKQAKWKIMVCHTPPIDTAIDTIRSGSHVGSSIVRKFIETHHPHVCISGHIHEARGEDWIGDTHVLNAGPFGDGWYIEVDIDNDNLIAALKSVA